MQLFAIEDAIARQRKYFELEERASALRCVGKFKKLFKLFEKEYKSASTAIITDYDNGIEYPEKSLSFRSGAWQQDSSGAVFTMTDNGPVYACPHPIVPVGILTNAETGLCKTMLMFRVRNKWKEVNVPRETLASANKIVSLASWGVHVTTGNANALVKYLLDIESLNEDTITDHIATSKLGWIGQDFMPYSTSEIIFDNDPKLMTLFNSIHDCGSRQKWLDTMLSIRREGHPEVLVYTAASLASVLVEPCGALPFIVSLWGGSGLGKTVALMLATSIWADPSEGAYMSDAKATTTAMEIRLDALNSLPMCIDDMAQIRMQDDDFSQIIYRWCAGKGRDRSNQNLGLNPLTRWANCTLTNGERSLITDISQGGASNRVIDIEIGEAMFKNGNKISKLLRSNYGFAGREFVDYIKELGPVELNKRFEYWVDRLKKRAAEKNSDKEDKQINPMALILLADELSEGQIYKDGIRLNVDTCLDYLKDKNDVSENRRAYDYLRDCVLTNEIHFRPDIGGDYRSGVWGCWLNEKEVAIIPTEFNRMLAEGNFQGKSFMSWASRNKLLVTDGDGKHDKPKISLCNRRVRCVVIDMSIDFEDLNGNFDALDTDSDIPFN